MGNRRIYYNNHDYILPEDTNLPMPAMLFNTTDNEIYWKVEQKYDSCVKELCVRLVDCNAHGGAEFSNQKHLLKGFKIQFDRIIWEYVKHQLFVNEEVGDFFIGLDPPKSITNAPVQFPVSRNSHVKVRDLDSDDSRDQSHNIIQDKKEILVRIADLTFQDEFATFNHLFPGITKPVEIRIQNAVFKSGFQHISGYFARILKRDNVLVQIDYEQESDQIKILSVKCELLERISKSNIDSIKVIRTNKLTLPASKETKPLLDLAELFQVLSDDSSGKNVFKQTEHDLINHFAALKGVRNKQHLSYLANEIHSISERLRFTLNPDFGFLFHHESEKKIYYIWELLNSHATYIWFQEKVIMTNIEIYKEVEHAMEYIKVLRRDKYKRAYKERKVNAEINFKLLSHKRSEISGFSIWKENLQSILI